MRLVHVQEAEKEEGKMSGLEVGDNLEKGLGVYRMGSCV